MWPWRERLQQGTRLLGFVVSRITHPRITHAGDVKNAWNKENSQDHKKIWMSQTARNAQRHIRSHGSGSAQSVGSGRAYRNHKRQSHKIMSK